MEILNEIKASFKKGSYLTQLIYINLAVFVLINLVQVFWFLIAQNNSASPAIYWLSLPADLSQFIWKPWTIVTYMFLHEGFMHVLFNMLWLYWFGQIFLQYLDQKQLLSVYLLGGISGGLFYIIAYNLFPVFAADMPFSFALGASASVMAIVFAISFYVPNYEVHLFFIGKVKLKFIAIFSIFLDLLSIPNGNAGGHIAHIGGALFGLWFISEYKKGHLITKKFDRILNSFFTLFKKQPKMKVSYKKTGNVDYDYQNKKQKRNQNIDVILEKISKSGYSSLTKEEKEFLFKMSDKNKS